MMKGYLPCRMAPALLPRAWTNRSGPGELGDGGVLRDGLRGGLHRVAELLGVATLEHELVRRLAGGVVELLVPGVEQVTHEDVLAGLAQQIVRAGETGRDGDAVG